MYFTDLSKAFLTLLFRDQTMFTYETVESNKL